jgi:hypothetical protein
VHSPGGPSLLEAAAAAAVAAATAAAASSGAATADPNSTAAAAAGGSSTSSSPSRAGSRKLAHVVSFGASGRQGSASSWAQGSAAAGGVQGSAELPPKPANWGKSISVMARASDTSTADVAQEGAWRLQSLVMISC